MSSLLLLVANTAFAAEGSFVDECPQSAEVLALGAAARVELSYVNADDDGFAEARWELERALPCIDTEVGLQDAVAFHRARAIMELVDGDKERARRSLAAIRILVPDWTPPRAVMPPGSELLAMWEEGASPGDDVPLPENRGGFNVDGVRGATAPAWRAFVLQGFAPNGYPFS
jgi:hypothetical protein